MGQELTKANPNLRSERATGWETGVVWMTRYNTYLRASYFWTQVNRPITALTISTTPTLITEMRENLGQIESRGVSLDIETAPLHWLSLIGGYQYADATVTKFSQQPLTVACGNPDTTLIGCRIPQVAQNMGTLQARFSHPKIGVLSLQGRMSGSQYDNDLNTYLLHSYFRLDAYASHQIGKRFEVFATGENLFDRADRGWSDSYADAWYSDCGEVWGADSVGRLEARLLATQDAFNLLLGSAHVLG